jgi:type IV pilus assembly protein PilB
MVASALVGVVSMRLVRKICPKCSEAYTAEASELNRFTAAAQSGSVTLRRGRGCPNCHDSGFVGRTGIFELLEVDATVRQLIFQNASDIAIRQAAAANGLVSMSEDGLRKVLEGHTTVDEVARVVYISDQGGKVCQHCRSVLSSDFDYCPSCCKFAADHCEKCRRRVTPEWEHCPYCGTATRHASSHKLPKLNIPAEARRDEGDGILRRAS